MNQKQPEKKQKPPQDKELLAKYNELQKQVRVIPKLVAQNKQLLLQIRHIKSRHNALHQEIEQIKRVLTRS